jgi:hypothetical protein
LRQLILCGFSPVVKGTDYGAYYHEVMNLCQIMRRFVA